jgi:hypothetical protein
MKAGTVSISVYNPTREGKPGEGSGRKPSLEVFSQGMASRIRPHWEDVKGNAKWDFIKYVWWLVAPFLTAIFTSAVAYVKNASMWQVIFLGIVVGLIVFGLIVLARYLFGQDNRPKGKAFLFSVGKDKGRAPNASKSYGDICWWYRVEITTDRPEGIKGCMGRLIKIRRGEKILFEKEEVILTFAPGENPDTTAKFIYPKTEFPLDLFYITQQNEIKVDIQKR